MTFLSPKPKEINMRPGGRELSQPPQNIIQN